MNERIKELAEQAGLSEGVFTRHDGVPCNLKGYSMLPDEMEKFAELLVRECANYMNRRIPGNIEVSATIAKMKQHFGVIK